MEGVVWGGGEELGIGGAGFSSEATRRACARAKGVFASANMHDQALFLHANLRRPFQATAVHSMHVMSPNRPCHEAAVRQASIHRQPPSTGSETRGWISSCHHSAQNHPRNECVTRVFQ